MNKIKINIAGLDELCTLKGVGEKIATRIILHRESVGFFESPEDLMEVKGIGERFIEVNKDRLDFELPVRERMERMKNKIMEKYVNPLTRVFIKGEQSGDRPRARAAMEKLKEEFSNNYEEGWELVMEWAVAEFKAHKEEGKIIILGEDMLPLEDDETLLTEAKALALSWSKAKGLGLNVPVYKVRGGDLDEKTWKEGFLRRRTADGLDQEYADTLEELLLIQHKLDEEASIGRSVEENDHLLKEEESLELKLKAIELKILEDYEREEARPSTLNEFLKIIREKPMTPGEAYIARLRIATEERVALEIRQSQETWREEDDPSSPSINLENYDEVNEAFWEEGLTKAPQLRWLSRPAKGWKKGGFTKEEVTTRIQDNNWHNRHMREQAEQYMQEIITRRQRDHGLAAHGQELVDGKMKVFIFPETEDLLSKYRARIKVLANSLNEEDYEAKLKEARAVMVRLFSERQKRGQARFRAEFIQALKKDLNELRTIFFMPYDRAQLKSAQREHMEERKPMKWIPKFCKKDLQLNKLEIRNREGRLVSKAGSPLAFLSKEGLITLYNDGVARLLAMGVPETELSNFSGSPFLKTYEQHMAAQGKDEQARAAIQARKERDEKAEEMKFRTQLNSSAGGGQVRRGDNVASLFDDDEVIGLDFVGEQASPEEQVMFLEIWED